MLIPLHWLAVAAAAIKRGSALDAPVVTLPDGATVVGVVQSSVSGNPIHAFLGIPYADAPVGAKRWTQSKLKTLDGDLNATRYGSICFGDPSMDPISGQLPPSEDCLFLNVFKPAHIDPESRLLPVMVWIHGGGFIAGAGNPYPGNNLIGASDAEVIVVSFNYRLGVFGFLSNPDIVADDNGANFGLRDQEVAFQWVQHHIRHFGGDPEAITAFGESAGAWSLASHLLSRDGDQQLFQRAILQSGGYTPLQSMAPPRTQTRQTDAIAAVVGCRGPPSSVLACLRKTDASTIFTASKGLSWGPTVDKVFLYDTPYRRLVLGKMSRIPTVIGVNTDDGWGFSVAATEASQFDSWIRSTFTLMTEHELTQLTELYPAANFSTPHHRTSEIISDFQFVCPGELISSVQSLTMPNTYRYRFNFFGKVLGPPLVTHATDLDYVFNRVANLQNDTDTTIVVTQIQKFWTNFALSGSPNGHAEDSSRNRIWPEYDAFTKHQIILQPALAVEADAAYMPGHAARCRFWHTVEARVALVLDE